MSKLHNKLYVITRSDLSTGMQAAQICHSMTEFFILYPKIIKQWHDGFNIIVVLTVKDEDCLITLMNKATNQGINIASFMEPDLNNTITSIVLEPGLDSRSLCTNIKLTA